MKSLVFAFAFLGCAYSASAQKGELITAKTNYEKYIALKDAGSLTLAGPSLTIAKTSIDKAALNEKTAIDASTWAYKALIYANLALNEADAATAEALIKSAGDDFSKAVEMDTDKKNANLITAGNDAFAQFQLNKGVKAFQAQDFKQAYTAFEQSLIYRPADTLLTYYSGLAAINAVDYTSAIKRYEELLTTDYSANREIALDLSKLYSMQKDTVNAIRIASVYATKFNDQALATQEIELSLMSGKQKQVIERILAQITLDPKNKLEHFYLGIAYDALKEFKKAEDAYKKAIDLDANYFDATLNLGSGILNNGIDLYNKANTLPANKQKEYDAAMKAAFVEFDRAFPYLDKAVKIDPKSLNALQNLKTYYVIKKNTAKVAELTKQITALQ
ncbi:MAG: tetratricopeptide repeat protein [Sphingobacteriales bacterium]|nr:tetratricopeptide repeat protein [Sphingobacteriales bacterium]